MFDRMNRMKRCLLPKLFPILAAGSLALAIGVAGVWGVSYWRDIRETRWVPLFARGTCTVHQLGLSAGALTISRGEFSRFPSVQDLGWAFHSLPHNPQLYPWTDGLWFAHWTTRTTAVRSNALRVPLWFPLLLFLILPAVWLRRFRSERRKQREGLCRQCGYDLRAHSPGQVCPECGTPVPAELVRKPMEQTP